MTAKTMPMMNFSLDHGIQMEKSSIASGLYATTCPMFRHIVSNCWTGGSRDDWSAALTPLQVTCFKLPSEFEVPLRLDVEAA
jgi:hypothetical protein